MKKSTIKFFFSVVILSILVTACGGAVPGSWPGMTVNQDKAFIADASFIYSINLSNGTMAWKYPATAANGISYYAPPVLSPDGKQLLIGDYGTTLNSLDPTTGNMVWSFKEAKGRWIGSPLVTTDTIYAPSADNNLYALNFQGQKVWSFSTKAALWAQPMTDGKVIYQGSMDHFLYAIQPQNGTQIWKSDVGGAIEANPFLDQSGVIYLGTLGSEILAVQATNGQILWRTTTSGAIWSSPVVQDGTLYIGDLSGTIYAISAKNGSIIWQQKTVGAIAGPFTITPQGLVYGNDAGTLTEVDIKTGNSLWSKTFNGKLYTGPVFTSGHILVTITGSTDSTLLVALDPTGNQIWSFVPPK